MRNMRTWILHSLFICEVYMDRRSIWQKQTKAYKILIKKRINRTIRIGILRNENVHVYRTMQRFVWIEKKSFKKMWNEWCKTNRHLVLLVSLDPPVHWFWPVNLVRLNSLECRALKHLGCHFVGNVWPEAIHLKLFTRIRNEINLY